MTGTKRTAALRALALLGAAAVAAAVPACGSGGGRTDPGPAELLLVPIGTDPGPLPEGVKAVAWVEVAADPASRTQGLMERDSLAPESGMVFLYPDSQPRAFWMKNTWIPLSIAFADRWGRILAIHSMAPGTGVPDEALPRYASGGPAMMALEMEEGWFSRNGIEVGDRMALHPELQAIDPR